MDLTWSSLIKWTNVLKKMLLFISQFSSFITQQPVVSVNQPGVFQIFTPTKNLEFFLVILKSVYWEAESDGVECIGYVPSEVPYQRFLFVKHVTCNMIHFKQPIPTNPILFVDICDEWFLMIGNTPKIQLTCQVARHAHDTRYGHLSP